MSDDDQYDWRTYDLSDMTAAQQEEFKNLLARRKARDAMTPEERAVEANLPSNRRFRPTMNKFIRTAFPATKLPDGEFASLDELQEAAELLFDPEPYMAESLAKAFDYLRDVGDNEYRRAALQFSLSLILLVAMSSESAKVSRAAERERASLKGITARNQAISLASDRARVIAVDLWEQDEEQVIRIGDMAQRVWAVMIDEGLSEHMPEQADRLKVWIKPVAPAYATKGGRTKKPPRT